MSTPVKNTIVTLATGSPRLRSPRGTTPRNNNAPSWGFLRHTKTVLIVVTVATMVFLKPAGLDSRAMSTFVDQTLVTGSMTRKNPGTIDDDDAFIDSSKDPIEAPETAPSVMGAKYRISDTDPVSDDWQHESKDDYAVETIVDPSILFEVPSESIEGSRRDPTFTNSSADSISSYNSTMYPLIRGKSSNPKPVDVHFVVDVSEGIAVAPPSKFLLDGIERSSYTNVASMTFLNPKLKTVEIAGRANEKLIWLIDWGSMHRDCHRLEKVLTSLERNPKEKVLLADYTGSTRQTQCDFWDENVRVAKRSIVTGRHYDHKKKSINPGKIAINEGMSKDLPVLRAPLAVRERFVTALKDNSRGRNPMKSKRTTDVCFFWKEGDYSHYGFWRRDVSNFIKELGKSGKFKTHVDIAANDVDGMEIGNLQLNYVDELLDCKMVVIAQRDEWEDHYRLYESLASGALVLMDTMLAIPAGLKNKTNVAIYDDLESLQSQLKFYLKEENRRVSIARRGMELALGYYRAWHRIEELIFGRPLTLVNKAYEEAPDKAPRPPMDFEEETDIYT